MQFLKETQVSIIGSIFQPADRMNHTPKNAAGRSRPGELRLPSLPNTAEAVRRGP